MSFEPKSPEANALFDAPIIHRCLAEVGDDRKLVIRSVEFEDMDMPVFEAPHFPPDLGQFRHAEDPGDLQAVTARFMAYAALREATTLNLFQANVEAMGPSPNNAEDVRCVVVIPMAVSEEPATITRTLEAIAAQEFDQRFLEVIIDANTTKDLTVVDPIFTPEEIAGVIATTSAVREFQSEAGIDVRMFLNIYDDEAAGIGAIRADAWGTASYDMLQRGRVKDVPILSWDSDVAGADPSYIRSIVEAFEAETTDIVTAELTWETVAELPPNSMTNRIINLYSSFCAAKDRYSGNIWTSDANTAVSLVAYSAAGGYNRSMALGETVELTDRIQRQRNMVDTARDQRTKGIVKEDSAMMVTSSRRLVEAMSRGHAPHMMWDPKFQKFDAQESLRSNSVDPHRLEAAARNFWPGWVEDMAERHINIFSRHIGVELATRVVNELLTDQGFHVVIVEQETDSGLEVALAEPESASLETVLEKFRQRRG